MLELDFPETLQAGTAPDRMEKLTRADISACERNHQLAHDIEEVYCSGNPIETEMYMLEMPVGTGMERK
eukprot:gene24464-29747_t